MQCNEIVVYDMLIFTRQKFAILMIKRRGLSLYPPLITTDIIIGFYRSLAPHRQTIPKNGQTKLHFTQPIIMLSRDISEGVIGNMHQHPFGQFAYAVSGVMFVITEVGSYIVPPNRGVWIPEGVMHCARTPSGARMRSLLFNIGQSPSMPDSCCVTHVTLLLRELIIEASSFPKEYDWQGREGRVMKVIRDQISQMNVVPMYLPLPQDNKLQSITNQLLNNPSDNRNLNEWGAMVGASARTLSRAYLKETGLSFLNWRQLFRIQTALQKLADGNSVTTVALDVGYSSVSAFITMFQKHMGYTPGTRD